MFVGKRDSRYLGFVKGDLRLMKNVTSIKWEVRVVTLGTHLAKAAGTGGEEGKMRLDNL